MDVVVVSLLLTLNIFIHCSSVSFVAFEQVNAGWGASYLLLKQFIGNKAKQHISKRVFQENKARQIFRKTNVCVCVRVRIIG